MKKWLPKAGLPVILFLALTVFFSSTAFAQPNYYYRGTGALNTLASWSPNANGVGGASPTSFTTAGQTFSVRNIAAVSTTAAWTVSGTGSKIIVGDGTTATNLTVATAGAITGTVDVSASSILTVTNLTVPTLGTLNISSSVIFNGSGAQAIPVPTSSYGNLTYSGSSAGTFVNSFNVAGNLLISSGNIFLSSSNAAKIFNITGSLTISTTGTIDFQNTNNKQTTINVAGNFSKTAGTITTSANAPNGIINFSGTNQNIACNSADWTDFFILSGSTCTLSGTFNFNVASDDASFNINSGGILVCGTNIMTGDASTQFTLNSGGSLQIGSSAGITVSGATGNIQMLGTRTFSAGANYTYNGTAAQATGTGYPTNLTGILTINNSGNTVTLSAARTIASGGTINLTAGTFAAGTSLTMATTSNINRSEGVLSGTLQGTGKYNVTYTGLSKTTGPELLNTGLNNLTINETASSNTVTSGNAFTAAADVTVTQGNLIIQGTDASYTATGNLVVATNGTFTHSVNWDATGKQFNVGGNIDVTGIITYTVRSHISMTGTTKTIRTGTPPASAMSIVTLSGATVSANGTVTINDNFWAPFNTAGSFSTNGQTVTANAGVLIAGGTVNVNGGTLTVTNGISVGVGATGAGTLSVSSGTLTTDGITLGDVASTVANTITQSGGTFTVTGGVTINQPVANTLTNAWNINAQTATVAGLISMVGTATATNKITNITLTTGTLNANGGISFAGTTPAFKVINLGTTGTLNLKGALTGAANATLTSGTAGSTFNYNDNAAAQTISFFGAGSYNNLHVNTTGGAGAALSAAVTVSNVTGNLRVQSGTLDNGGFAIAGVSGKTFEVANGATFILSGTTSAFPTVFTPSLGATGTVNYAGSGAQVLSAQSYGNLTTSNTSSLTMTGNSGVATTLTFTSGKITTGANTLTLASGASISGAGTGKYVYGNLAWTFPTGTPTRTFEIGDATNYAPLTIAYTTTITTGGAVTAFTTAGDYSPLTGSGFIANKTVNRTWTVSAAGTIAPATPGYTATFNFVGPTPGSGDIDAAATPSNFVVKRFSASTWNATTAGTRSATSTEATAINGYGVFQIGEVCVAPTINTPAITNISCNGSTDGAIDITTTGGTTPFTYAWTGPGAFTAATEDISGLAAGNYSLTITASGGCTVSSGTITITQPAVLSATVTPTNISCNGSADGSIVISAPAGGYGTYEYTINGGTNWQSSGSFTGLSTATYNVKIRDAAHTACIVTLNASLTITQPAVLNATVGSTNISCNGSTDAAITITSPSGGYGTYQYTINGGTNWQSSGSFTGLSVATYNVKIRDAAHTACIVTLNGALVITQPAVLNATVGSTNISCNGSSDGAITITSPSGGYGTYQYTINGGTNWQSSGSFTGLSVAAYNVKIRDAAHTACIVTLNASLTITQPAVLSATVGSTNISCNGSADGTITVTSPSGGYGTYEYTINGGVNWQSSGSFTGLSAATYNVKIRDAAHTACIATLNGALVITQPAVLSATVASTNVSCNGSSDAAITITSPSGGYGTYEYTINGGTNWQSSGSFTGLSAATYNVKIRDAAHTACIATLNGALSVTQPVALSATVNSTNITCHNANDGTITITSPAGGYGTYEYSINGGTSWQSSGSYTALAGTTYNVQIRDAAHTACIVTLNGSLTIVNPAVLNATVNSANVTCNGGNDGSITITSATGGLGTYEYSNDGGDSWQSSGSFTSLSADTYNVQIRDAANTACVVTLNGALVITQPVVLNATVNSTNVTCNASSDGTITISSPTGGFGTYEYSIDGGSSWQSSGSFTGLGATGYTVQIRDAAHTSCVVTLNAALFITEPAALSATVNSNNITCNGAGDGTITITSPAGGYGTYEYSINGGASWQSSGTYTSLVASTYNVQIRDAAHTSCLVVLNATLTITNPVALNATVNSTNANCSGSNDGTITITGATGGYGTYEYSINGGTTWQSAGSFTSLSPATYNVQIRDAAHTSCVVILNASVTITDGAVVTAPVSGGDETVCYNGNPTQTLIATATSAFTISWYTTPTGGSAVASPAQIGVGSTTYYAEASNGSCVSASRTAVTVTIQPVLATPGAISGPTDVCPLIGSATPTIYSISAVSGATSYTWTVPVGTTIVSGQGTTSLSVTFDNSFALTNSIFRVIATSPAACTSAASSVEVLKVIPGIPTAINGPVDLCTYIDQPVTATYSIDPVPNATSYTWTVSPGASIVSGQGSVSVEVSFTSVFNLGTIKVTANSNCGNRAPKSLNLGKVIPVAPSAIAGTTDACPYIGTATQQNYSISAVANATSYVWTVPANVSLVSGQGTTSIMVTFNTGYVTSVIKVRSVANCGSSGDRNLTVAASTYTLPGAISGPTNACAYIGVPDVATYTIRKVANAASYIWTVPAGASITSHPAGAGLNDTIVTVSFNSSFVSGSNISVQSAGCVPSAARTLSVLRTLPSTPGLITGNTNACPNMVSATNPSGLPSTYTIFKVTNATSYVWTAPSGSTITAHPGGSGVNDTIVQITYSSGFTSGTLSVSASNACGSSAVARTLSITKLTPGAPSAIDIMLTGACPTRQYSYTLAALPSNATSILWTIPATATLVAGQGTTSITVSYPATAVMGTVTATPYNNCSSSSTRSITIKLPACAPAGRSSGKEIAVEQAPKGDGKLSVSISPNPSVADFKLEVLSNVKEAVNIRILDISGKELKRTSMMPYEKISIGSELKAGTYILEVTQGRNRTTEKLLKF